MADLTPDIASFPVAFAGLFEPKRYKVYYGGRGAGRSWSFARALLLEGVQRPLRVLCAREFQNSIKDSVHKVLCDQITAMGLEHLYEILKDEIKGPGGTEFIFAGIKTHIGKIKSFEGIDRCWVEEAEKVSKHSWDVLIPTIRKPDSEIWISFNPSLEEDETYKRFVLNPTDDMLVRFTNWRDNPFFPEVLRTEMENLKARDYDAYMNVWEGHCVQVLDGAIYADELREALNHKRLTRVPYDHTKPVSTFWDLGFSDMTSIWFAQIVGFEYRVLDYYQNRLKSLDHYLQVLQNRQYVYDTDWLPHDAQAKQLSAAGRTIEEQMRAKGRRVRIVPRHSLNDGIAAARSMFPQCYFDADRCADGLQCLRHYRYDTDDDERKSLSAKPLHDWASHGADAFRQMAMSLREPKQQVQLRVFDPRPKLRISVGRGMRKSAQGWMK